MTQTIIVQFVGCQVRDQDRAYTFSVREPSSDPREFTLTIATEAFNSRRVRIQDAPDVCSLKLRRELAAYSNHPPDTHYCITDADLDDYRTSHAPRAPKSPFSRKPVEDY